MKIFFNLFLFFIWSKIIQNALLAPSQCSYSKKNYKNKSLNFKFYFYFFLNVLFIKFVKFL